MSFLIAVGWALLRGGSEGKRPLRRVPTHLRLCLCSQRTSRPWRWPSSTRERARFSGRLSMPIWCRVRRWAAARPARSRSWIDRDGAREPLDPRSAVIVRALPVLRLTRHRGPASRTWRAILARNAANRRMRATGHTHLCRPAARRRTRSARWLCAHPGPVRRAKAVHHHRRSAMPVQRPYRLQCHARWRENHVHGICTPSQHVGAPRLRDVAVAMSGSARSVCIMPNAHSQPML